MIPNPKSDKLSEKMSFACSQVVVTLNFNDKPLKNPFLPYKVAKMPLKNQKTQFFSLFPLKYDSVNRLRPFYV